MDFADRVNWTRWSDFVALAYRSPAIEDAEGFARGPIGQVTEFDRGYTVLRSRADGNLEVDLVSPFIVARFNRQRIPNQGRGDRIVEFGFEPNAANLYLDLPSHKPFDATEGCGL